MTNQPLISILTPCYNYAPFLEECIKSVLAQNYPYVEHVIQDAGSTDGSVGILKKYMDKNRVNWISEPDKGQADGLNKALQRSKGDIILTLNADDILLPHACSWAVENLNEYQEYAAVYGDVYIINDKGVVTGTSLCLEPCTLEKFICLEVIIPNQAAFVRRSCWKTVGFYVDASLDTCPDFEMWVRILRKFKVKHVPCFVTKYRVWHSYGDQLNRMEGGYLRTVDRFIKAKKNVMDRIFNNPEIPVEIRRLRQKAYIGLYSWGVRSSYMEKESIWIITRYFLKMTYAAIRGLQFKALLIMLRRMIAKFINYSATKKHFGKQNPAKTN